MQYRLQVRCLFAHNRLKRDNKKEKDKIKKV